VNVKIVESIPGFLNTTVVFSSPYGSAQAEWIGERPPPKVAELHVELEIEQTLVFGENTKQATLQEPSIHQREDSIVIAAEIDSVFSESETACLRIGDSLVLVDYEGSFPSPHSWIEVQVSCLKIYDVSS